MFNCAMRENQQNRVLITDVKYEVLRETLRYIYSGKSPNVIKMADDLLVAADKYDLSELKKTCETVLGSQLTVANAANLLVLADTHCAQQLKAQAIRFVTAHAEEIMLTPTWNNMNLSHPHIIVEVLSKKVLGPQSSPRNDGAMGPPSLTPNNRARPAPGNVSESSDSSSDSSDSSSDSSEDSSDSSDSDR